MSALPFDPIQARKVKGDLAEPTQQPTSRGQRTRCNYFARRMLKHQPLSEFHSLPELYCACLNEGNPAVISYVPQPFTLWVGNRRYIPDVYISSEDQGSQVIELKPDGKMEEALQVPLIAFFRQHRMTFRVVANETILEQRVEAENWLEIVTILVQARALETRDAEQQVLEFVANQNPCTVGDIVAIGDRERTYYQEVALFRLLHQGVLNAALKQRALDYDTEVML